MSIKLVVKVLIISECSLIEQFICIKNQIIKLTNDAFKELIEINSCKYTFKVATHLNVPL